MKLKRYVSDIYNYNKPLLYTIIGIIVTIIIGIFVLFSYKPKSDNSTSNDNFETKEVIEKLRLFGKKEITIYAGEEYIEPGFYAVSSLGEIKTNDVIVTPDEFDTSNPGEYYINYAIGDKKEQRKVTILEKEEENIKSNSLRLTLEGNLQVVLEVGDEYVEPGYYAFDTNLGNITNKVIVEGKVDTNTPGTYTLTYKVENNSGEKKEKERTITVNDSTVEIAITTNLTTTYTNNDVIANIVITGNNFSYVKYPDNTTSTDKVSTYTIEENGYYKFYVYDKKNEYLVKELNVTGIDKKAPTGTCLLTVNNGKSTIEVKADDNLSGIKNYQMFANNNLVANSNSKVYSISASYTSAYVKVYDKAGNVGKINCTYKFVEPTVKKPNPKVETPDPDVETPVEEEPVKPEFDYLEMHFIVTAYNDDAILIRTGEATILIDSGRKKADKKVIPYLQGLGITTIDAIIGSHPHFNHIQAQSSVIENFKVKSSYYSVDLNTCKSKGYCDSKDVQYILDAIKKNNIPMNVMKPGDLIEIGDMTLYILGPYKLNNSAKYKQNSNSAIFILKYKNNTFMFTGDAPPSILSKDKIKPYADKLGISLDVDMFKYPHHGNANLEQALVNAMSPKYVIVPNYNYGSSFNSSGKSKIKKSGAKMYQMSDGGNIVLKSDGDNITVKTKQSAKTYKR